MIKCIHKECKWPVCDKTCGLVPAEETYSIGASAEEGLIYHLQNRIEELNQQIKEYEDTLNFISYSLKDFQKKIKVPNTWDKYERACKYGYVDCVCDPGYIRYHYPDWWTELGMPTTCEHCKDGNGYDD